MKNTIKILIIILIIAPLCSCQNSTAKVKNEIEEDRLVGIFLTNQSLEDVFKGRDKLYAKEEIIKGKSQDEYKYVFDELKEVQGAFLYYSIRPMKEGSDTNIYQVSANRDNVCDIKISENFGVDKNNKNNKTESICLEGSFYINANIELESQNNVNNKASDNENTDDNETENDRTEKELNVFDNDDVYIDSKYIYQDKDGDLYINDGQTNTTNAGIKDYREYSEDSTNGIEQAMGFSKKHERTITKNGKKVSQISEIKSNINIALPCEKFKIKEMDNDNNIISEKEYNKNDIPYIVKISSKTSYVIFEKEMFTHNKKSVVKHSLISRTSENTDVTIHTVKDNKQVFCDIKQIYFEWED